jgi:hypothetical protein
MEVGKSCLGVKVRRGDRNKQLPADVRQSYAEEPTDQGEQDTFGKQLSGNTPAPGSKSGAHGQFLLSRSRLGQQKTGHIRAGDQKDKCDDALNNQECWRTQPT